MSTYQFYNNIIPTKSIRTATCTNIKGNNKKYLLYACSNYLNMCSVDKDGYTDDYSKHALFSEVLELQEYIPEKLVDENKKENVKSYLLLLTRKYVLLLLEFDLSLNDFVTLSQLNLYEVNSLHIEEDIIFIVDKKYRTILFYGYKNILKYIYLDYDDYFNLNHLYTLRLDEGLIIDIIFLNDHEDKENKNLIDTVYCKSSMKDELLDYNKLEKEYAEKDTSKKKKNILNYNNLDNQNGVKKENGKKEVANADAITITTSNTNICNSEDNNNINIISNSNHSNIIHNRSNNTINNNVQLAETTSVNKEKFVSLFSSDDNNAFSQKNITNTYCEQLNNAHTQGKSTNADNYYTCYSKENKKNINATICILYDAKKKDSYTYERYIRVIPLYSLNDKKGDSILYENNEIINQYDSNKSLYFPNSNKLPILYIYFKPVIVDSSINKLLNFSKNRILLIGFQFISYINLEIEKDKKFFLSSELRTIRCIEKINTNKFILADDYGDLYILTCLYKFKSSSYKFKNEMNTNINYINLQFIGSCSRSNVIVSIYSDILFLGSQVSDSYLLRMHNYPIYDYDDYNPIEHSSYNSLSNSHTVLDNSHSGTLEKSYYNDLNKSEALSNFQYKNANSHYLKGNKNKNRGRSSDSSNISTNNSTSKSINNNTTINNNKRNFNYFIKRKAHKDIFENTNSDSNTHCNQNNEKEQFMIYKREHINKNCSYNNKQKKKKKNFL